MKAFLFITASCLLLFASCHTKLPIPAPKPDELPPYTERGANTFGCLIDGQVFVPKKNALSNYITLQCTYQYINDTMYFSLGAGNFITKKGVSIHTSNVTLTETSYAIGSAFSNNIYGLYSNFNTSNNIYYTNNAPSGGFNIKHFDTIHQTVSGTFWFDAIDTATNNIVHITDGRFDVSYTR